MRTHSGPRKRKGSGVAILGALACSLALPVSAQNQPTVQDLLQRLEALERRVGDAPTAAAAEGETSPATLGDLDQRLRILERRIELQQEETAAKAKDAPVVAVNDKGASLKSANGDYEFKLRALVQGDARFFLDDDVVPQNDTFLFRRIRPTIEGSLGKLVSFRLTPEFAGDSATIVDAYVDVKLDPALTLRAGKVKGPIGLERLQSGGAIGLIERSFPTELAPNRDLGIQAQGEFAEGRVTYVAGVYNGAPDGRDAATTNPDEEFEYAGRLFFEPFKNTSSSWSGLGFGIAGSIGDKQGTGNNFLPRYRTQGQAQFFNYRSAVAADGEHSRISPQGYLYRGRFGLLAEYIASKQELLVTSGAAAGTRADLENTAWQATASWVLTGEDASYRGVVKPSKPFSPGSGWGAWELVGRYGELEIDDRAFPLFADPLVAARRAKAWTLGVNWYLTSNLKLVVNYLDTQFEGGAAAGADREDEKAVFSRLQVAF
ncbi:porin [Pseudoxanthomonas sp. LjRoot168]|uniref:OprO/OprP family phosphate-selective porin n=1 Tax=unclassified Pseudoxanthomonas TaxID=2645906 RepID=UPI003ED02E21